MHVPNLGFYDKLSQKRLSTVAKCNLFFWTRLGVHFGTPFVVHSSFLLWRTPSREREPLVALFAIFWVEGGGNGMSLCVFFGGVTVCENCWTGSSVAYKDTPCFRYN